MGKGGKSSASSATRKKHAKKAEGPSQDQQPILRDKGLTKQQRAQKKKEPRVKVYIPPVKPAPVQQDPLETTGLVHSLPPELVIILRSFNKKAQVTKIRALEELQLGWIDKCRKEGEDGALTYVLADMLPVWLHHVPTLFVHASRRVRLLAAGVHLSFAQISPIRDKLLLFLRDTTTVQSECIIGTWCLAAHDIDKAVAATALKSWTSMVAFEAVGGQLHLDGSVLPSLLGFVQRAILDPNGVYMYLNPAPPVAPTPPPKKGARREEPEANFRSKAEELEESEQDRKARLRVGGLSAIRRITETIYANPPEDLVRFFKNPFLWSSLCHAEQCPIIDIESFGHGQHNVRKAAWGLILALLRIPKTHLDSVLPILGVAVLRSAWVEPDTTVHAAMWQPLLKFIKEFPIAWEVERAHDYSADEGPVDDAESGTDEEEEIKKSLEPAQIKTSIAYQEFLRFLELGCSGSPIQGYPTVVISLSTIPSSILTLAPSSSPLDVLFLSFWKVLGSRALSSLHRSATSAAFLSSLLECIVFLIKRVRNDGRSDQQSSDSKVKDVDEVVRSLVQEQFGKVWAHLADGTLVVEPRAAARLVTQTLLSLNTIDPVLFSVAWDALSTSLKKVSNSQAVLMSVFLKVSHDKFKHVVELRDAVLTLMSGILNASVQSAVDSIKVLQHGEADTHAMSLDGVPLLANMLDQFRESLFDDSNFAKLVDDMTIQHAPLLLELSSPFLLSYLTYRKDNGNCLQLWQALLASIAQHPEKAEHSVKPLLDATQRDVLPKYLKPSFGEIDSLVDNLISQVLGGDTTYFPFVQQVLQSPDYFLSANGYATLSQNISSTFALRVDLALNDSEVSLSSFQPSLNLITSLSQHPPRELPQHDFACLLLDIFVFVYVLPACYESQKGHPVFASAKALWDKWQGRFKDGSQNDVSAQIKTKLRDILRDTQLRPFPRDILEVSWMKPPGIQFELPVDIFPSPKEIDQLLDQLSSDPIHPSLAVLNPLIPPASVSAPHLQSSQVFDKRGFSSYARIISALLDMFIEDRSLAKRNLWALRHFQALEIYAQDFISIPSGRSDVFGPEAIHMNVDTLVSKVERMTTYLLTSSSDGWRRVALNAALENQPSQTLGALSAFLEDIIQRASDSDSVRDCRILSSVLQHIFHDVDKEEAEQWVLLARKVETTAPDTSMTLVSAVTNFVPESTRLNRYRNELAASLLGIPASKANVEGLLTLRKLATSAPNPESDVIFLPQLRAVNIAKACQQWISSDEDIDEEVESAMTLMFSHLAPILQDLSGSHWDLIFDILESNLEDTSLTDDLTLVTLSRTLRLVILIQDLTVTNKSLRTSWAERKMPILTMIRDLATTSLDDLAATIPRSTCRGLVLFIIQDLPSSLIDQDTFSKMSHLVTDTSVDVQKMAYRFLEAAAKKHTEYLVIEAGVDTEATTNAEIPRELLDILQRSIITDDTKMEPPNIFGHLLGWMLLFDLFQDSSLKVRSSYIDQLRNLDIIATHFIPTILSILKLDQGPLKAFKLDPWAVDEFHVDCYELGTEFSLSVLAAHLYYSALLTVPSLINTWVVDCKDRQLSSSFTNYTSHYFSPVITRTELDHVKSPESTALLVDDSFSIKVANAVNEVVASYSVDEHQLEIRMKIPADWPLHRIEVKDMKRIGVDENRWRAWMLAVQQIIWSHNGRIIDGLGLFKKNVTLHFEGQVECAICYSIISVMDGSLPKKPCRTCKNRFHAGCLYKWFNTSHSSSCPLCRSDIF